MQHIKDYISKIEKTLESKSNKKTKGSGLLASTKPMQSKETTDLDIVANFVQGIRTAKEEMKNGSK